MCITKKLIKEKFVRKNRENIYIFSRGDWRTCMKLEKYPNRRILDVISILADGEVQNKKSVVYFRI